MTVSMHGLSVRNIGIRRVRVNIGLTSFHIFRNLNRKNYIGNQLLEVPKYKKIKGGFQLHRNIQTGAVLLCLAAMLLSCGEESGTTTRTDTQTDASAMTESEDKGALAALPDIDYGGRAFRVAVSNDSIRDIAAEEMTGEVTGDAIFTRNSKVEEKYNIEITHNIISDIPGEWYKTLASSVLAGDDTYELGGHFAYLLYQAVSAGIYQDWNTVNTVDLSNEWWAQSINDAATFNGKLYGLSGYLGMSMMQFAEAMFFNTRICAEYDISAEQIYQLVYDGKWTFDVFSEMVKDIYVDLNGNNQADDEDLYGFCNASGTSYDLWQTAFDLPVTGKDKNGDLTEFVLSDKRTQAIAAMGDFLHNNPGTRILVPDTNKSTWWYEQYNFSIGQQAFTAGLFLSAYELYRNMDDVYSIAPLPKWDEEQKEYLTHLNDRYTIWGIPMTVADTDFVGTIAEALACESYENVYPAFYDVALKQKFSSDEDCANMVDIAMKGLRFDVAYMYGEYMANAPYLFRQLIQKNSTELASTYERNKVKMHQKFEDVMSFYED